MLYVAEISPVFYRLENNKGVDIMSYIGCFIMILGVLIESTADSQKSKAKQKDANRFCDIGLYNLVRCPNYFGEITFWTGVFVSGITAYSTATQWIISVIGYISILYIMFSGAKRLEIRQFNRYSSDKEFQSYSKHTPLILPLIPLYSLRSCKWIKI